MFECDPIAAKDQSRLHQFGRKVSPGICLGHAKRRGIWKGDTLVADIEELENLDASEIHAGRLNAKEVTMPKNCEFFILPMTDGNS